ncbi:MAG TPA: hypothetical protein VFJ87_05310 [Rhodanobacteraceae bacterium]|jgi:hypothetical protein|nr:hypothetical protein [Rhodanobacteraceae bacterium]
MGYLKAPLLACGVLLLAGCATQQPYLATHTNTSELAQIHELHVVSVIDQDKLKAQYNTTYVSPVVSGAPIAAGLVGGLIAGALISAEENHEAHEFAEKHIAPLLTVLAGYDGRTAVRESLHQGLATLPVQLADWRTADTKSKDADLLPASATAGSAWLILDSEYAMTPDFSGVQVVTHASLYLDGSDARWRHTPVYENELTYQSTLLQMPAKTEAVRQQMTDVENARYAKLDVDQQIAKSNAGDPYDPVNGKLREKIHDEQWQHQAKLKQIASPYWSPDERARKFVTEWQQNGAEALKQFVTEGGTQTARMLAIDLEQPQPDLDAKTKRDWVTVYHDAQRSIQDAPDGKVYSVANGDVTHGAAFLGQSVPVYVAPAAH